MQAALLSLLVGSAVGVAYALVNVRSPAPPIVALIGLLGIVIGEQGVIRVKDQWRTTAANAASSSPASPGNPAISRTGPPGIVVVGESDNRPVDVTPKPR